MNREDRIRAWLTTGVVIIVVTLWILSAIV